MSLSGSADSDRSTNRMFGLAETDRDWTALRSPPLLTFSGDQPCSTAIGRTSSAVASSQTKAVNGSRRPARAWKGAFIYLSFLRVEVSTFFSGRLVWPSMTPVSGQRAIHVDRLGRGRAVLRRRARRGRGRGPRHWRPAAASAPFTPQPKLLMLLVVEIGLRRAAPVGAAGNMRLGAADDDPDRAGRDHARGDRRAVADQHAILAGDRGDLAARGGPSGPST